jgi:fatty acid desaturase
MLGVPANRLSQPAMTTSPDAIVSPDLTTDGIDPLALTPAELKTILARRDGPAWWRLSGHLLFLTVMGTLWLGHWYTLPGMSPLPWWIAGPALLLYGIGLATMFAAMHECVHRTAFKTNALNDAVGWFAGLLSFYNSTFYRHYHGWHHRFTQIPGKDPELEDRKPTSVIGYLIEISALTWWIGKIRGHLTLAAGRIADRPYVPENARAEVLRSVRLQLLAYALIITVSAIFQSWWFVFGWLLPLAVGQPFLRVFVLSEHTGCPRDGDRYGNTRTTITIPLIQFLMWEMPYHAEHHRHPAAPFHALGQLHAKMRPHLKYLATDGYLEVQRGLIRRLGKDPA